MLQSEQFPMTEWSRENTVMAVIMMGMIMSLLSFLLYYSYKQKSEVIIKFWELL